MILYFFVFRKSGWAVGAATTHIEDILECGEPDLLLKVRRFLGNCFSKLKVQGESCAHGGVELAQEGDFSVTSTQEDFTKILKFLATSPTLRAGRGGPASMDDTKMRQCKLGVLCWVAAVSRPDIRARSAKIG